MLLMKFHFCSDDVKNKLFSSYCSNLYLCSLWAKYKSACMRRFIVAYNNGYTILHSLPMRCNASEMFATFNVNSCTTSIRKSIYSLISRLGTYRNYIVRCIANSDVHIASMQNRLWLRLLYTVR